MKNIHFFLLLQLALVFCINVYGQRVLDCEVKGLESLGVIYGFGVDGNDNTTIYSSEGLYSSKDMLRQEKNDLGVPIKGYSVTQTCFNEDRNLYFLAYQSQTTTPFWNKILVYQLDELGQIGKLEFSIEVGNLYITKVVFDASKNQLYIATFTGLYAVNVVLGKSLYPRSDLSLILPESEIYDMYIDDSKSLWIASRAGLHKMVGNKMYFQPYSKGIRAIAATQDYIYAAGQKVVFCCLKNAKPKEMFAIDFGSNGNLFDLLIDPIRDISIDKNGFMWLASNAIGGFRLSNPVDQFYINNNNFSYDLFTKLEVDEENNILVTALDTKLFYVSNCADIVSVAKVESEITAESKLLTADELNQIHTAVIDTVANVNFSIADKLIVSESGYPDGDRISLIINDHWLLKNVELSKEEILLDILPFLKTKDNSLIIWAEDDGKNAGVTVKLNIGNETKPLFLPMGTYQFITIKNQ
jgi:hypothetical protein